MDLVLEGLDAYVFDFAYAKLFPASLSSHIPHVLQKSLDLGNDTFKAVLAHDPTQALINVNQNSALNHVLSELQQNEVYGHFPVWFDTSVYTNASLLPRTNLFRQSITLFLVMWIFGLLLYLGVATFSYIFIFDKAIFNHPRYLKNQMSLEIQQAVNAIPMMVALTVPWFLIELQGYSKLYWDVNTVRGGWISIVLQYPAFIMFTDLFIYLIHRWLHWPKVYKLLHKPHHKWLVTTPYASHAFHPVDGYFQSLPYHVYPFIFPLHKLSYLLLFTFVNFWTVMIHDGEYMANDPVINGAACHTVHHLYFNYNYGQFTTLWDRIGKSYREPDRELFDKNKKKSTDTWKDQVSKMEAIKDVVEGRDDDRVYGTEEQYAKKQN
ncbi:C-5 sterol desaturase [Wickerhamomyces ciferrii]|uniref:C-5 sterol desaturase n=1 Tax=Wickerhamomyces ciferrii (strain ATCC 14091 / BCRC 22168 / CBS 111 / JCM 3599 / NBRC 0793 / NRRL Y-1031 F-60-10) TaxID=1206466 RepID=K0K825_WICCF|nr:C-5 sterol desaturase [Wickerhamomyces ciferrii]CCH40970.1 C-5 sterol desaturase [Wickerhamomyces ciferrii]